MPCAFTKRMDDSVITAIAARSSHLLAIRRHRLALVNGAAMFDPDFNFITTKAVIRLPNPPRQLKKWVATRRLSDCWRSQGRDDVTDFALAFIVVDVRVFSLVEGRRVFFFSCLRDALERGTPIYLGHEEL